MKHMTPEQRLVHNAKQHVAAAAVKTAIEKGWLVVPETCEECGEKPPRVKAGSHQPRGSRGIQAAHYDYDHPLDVRWLCIRCHRGWDSDPEQYRSLLKFTPRSISTLVNSASYGTWDQDYGYSVKLYRRSAGMTQSELAEETGISQASISKMENGFAPSPETVLSVVNTLEERSKANAKFTVNAKEDIRKARGK